MPGLFCILAGGILALVLCLGFGEEVKENWDNLSINEENFWEFFKVDKFMSVTRTGKRYSKSETKETYSFTVPAEEEIHEINYSVDCGIGKVEIAGDNCHGNVESYHHDKNSADFFELECGIGRIEIDVK